MPKQQVISKSPLVPTVLISGGAGFIGSHLAEYLLWNKARVIVLDNFNTGKEIHVKHLLNEPNFALYDVDINEGIPEDIKSVDYIFHLAGLEEYFYSKEYLNLDALFTNSLGTKNLLDLARKSSAKFLLASTIDIYKINVSQSDIPNYFGVTKNEENRFSLLEAKRFAEALVWEYQEKYNLDARIVRLPEVYGPRMDLSSSGFLGGYIKNVLDGVSIDIYGDGVEKEYYLYISDVISGIVKAQFSENTSGKIFSLVPENPISSLEAAYLVRSVADSKLSIQFKKGLTDFKSDLPIPDTSNVKEIGWKPKVSMKEGIMKTLESFNYSPNVNAFKPAKYLEKKVESKLVLPETISSLQGIKITSKPKKVDLEEGPVKEDFQGDSASDSSQMFVKKKRFNVFGKRPKIKGKKGNIGGFSNRVRADVGYAGSILAIIIAAVIVFVGIPGFSMYFNVKNGVSSLKSLEKSVLTIDSKDLLSESSSAYENFRNSLSSLKRLKWAFSLAGKDQEYTSYEKLLSSAMLFSRAANFGSEAIKPLESVLESIRPDSPSTVDVSLFEKAKSSVKSTSDYIKMAEADISLVDESFVPEKYKDDVQYFKNILPTAQEGVDSVSIIISGLPELLGVTDEKKYIIWFQNSNEIRPTGGFIGSYAVVTIESGKIKNIIIDDIYNPDGQIEIRNIQSIPPDPIKEFLGEDTLYLRNSNWDPDFTKSAKTFDDLYFKVTGETIDGYIAVDLNFVENLLRVTGPIFLASYNEDINAENIDERTQYYSGFDYKDGSTDKKSFLTNLGGKLLERIFSLKKEDFPKLAEELKKSLDQRHIQIYFSNSPINSLLKEKRWDGSLVDTSGDYLFVVNANLGGTKSNYYVDQNMSYEISSMTRDGLLRASLYLDYENKAESNAWPGGPYTNYVRVLTQDGSKLTGAKIIFSEKEEEDVFDKVLTSKVGKYTSFETNFQLPPKSSVRLVLNYDLPVNLSLSKDAGLYSLIWQKQAGTSDDKFSFKFTHPFGSVIKEFSKDLNYTDGSLISEGTFVRDIEYYVYFK